MANTYTQILFHVIFSTKDRRAAIREDFSKDLYTYIWGIHRNHKCHLYRIGGVEDHVHILTAIHPAMALSKYVELVKSGSSGWIRRENKIPAWPGWQDGYGALSVSWSDREAVVEYIKRQQEHHREVGFIDEYKRLLEDAGIEYNEKYLV